MFKKVLFIVFTYVFVSLPCFCVTNLLEAINTKNKEKIEQLYVGGYYPFFLDINFGGDAQIYCNQVAGVIKEALADNELLEWFSENQKGFNDRALKRELEAILEIAKSIEKPMSKEEALKFPALGNAELGIAQHILVPEIHHDPILLREQFRVLYALLSEDDVVLLEGMAVGKTAEFTFEYDSVIGILVAEKMWTIGERYELRNKSIIMKGVVEFLAKETETPVFIRIDDKLHINDFPLKKVVMTGWDEVSVLPNIYTATDFDLNLGVRNTSLIKAITDHKAAKRFIIRVGALHSPHMAFARFLAKWKTLNEIKLVGSMRDFIAVASGLGKKDSVVTIEEYFSDESITEACKQSSQEMFEFFKDRTLAVLDFARVRDEMNRLGNEAIVSQVNQIMRGLQDPQGWHSLFEVAKTGERDELGTSMKDYAYPLFINDKESDQERAFQFLLFSHNNGDCTEKGFMTPFMLEGLRADVNEIDELSALALSPLESRFLATQNTHAIKILNTNDAEVIFFTNPSDYFTHISSFLTYMKVIREDDRLISFHDSNTKDLRARTTPITYEFISLVGKKRANGLRTSEGAYDPEIILKLENGLFDALSAAKKSGERILSRLGTTEVFALNIIPHPACELSLFRYSSKYRSKKAALALALSEAVSSLLREKDEKTRIVARIDFSALPIFPYVRYLLTQEKIEQLVPKMERQKARENLHVAQRLDTLDDFYAYMSEQSHREFFNTFDEGNLFKYWQDTFTRLKDVKQFMFYGKSEVAAVAKSVDEMIQRYLKAHSS